jgi:hypothetical protein
MIKIQASVAYIGWVSSLWHSPQTSRSIPFQSLYAHGREKEKKFKANPTEAPKSPDDEEMKLDEYESAPTYMFLLG